MHSDCSNEVFPLIHDNHYGTMNGVGSSANSYDNNSFTQFNDDNDRNTVTLNTTHARVANKHHVTMNGTNRSTNSTNDDSYTTNANDNRRLCSLKSNTSRDALNSSSVNKNYGTMNGTSNSRRNNVEHLMEDDIVMNGDDGTIDVNSDASVIRFQV